MSGEPSCRPNAKETKCFARLECGNGAFAFECDEPGYNPEQMARDSNNFDAREQTSNKDRSCETLGFGLFCVPR